MARRRSGSWWSGKGTLAPLLACLVGWLVACLLCFWPALPCPFSPCLLNLVVGGWGGLCRGAGCKVLSTLIICFEAGARTGKKKLKKREGRTGKKKHATAAVTERRHLRTCSHPQPAVGRSTPPLAPASQAIVSDAQCPPRRYKSPADTEGNKKCERK